MLNNFKINFRGVEITPQLKHTPMVDVLQYDYNDLHVCVRFDNLIYQTHPNKKYYENSIIEAVLGEFNMLIGGL